MTRNAATISREIRDLQHRLDVWYPHELAATNHTRRRASLQRQRTEDTTRLARLVTELGAAVQEGTPR